MTRPTPAPEDGFTGKSISHFGPAPFGKVAGYLNQIFAALLTMHDSDSPERPDYLQATFPAFWSYIDPETQERTIYLWDGEQDIPFLKISSDGKLSFEGVGTVVRVTEAEYEALPDGKLTDGKWYVIYEAEEPEEPAPEEEEIGGSEEQEEQA